MNFIFYIIDNMNFINYLYNFLFNIFMIKMEYLILFDMINFNITLFMSKIFIIILILSFTHL